MNASFGSSFPGGPLARLIPNPKLRFLDAGRAWSALAAGWVRGGRAEGGECFALERGDVAAGQNTAFWNGQTFGCARTRCFGTERIVCMPEHGVLERTDVWVCQNTVFWGGTDRLRVRTRCFRAGLPSLTTEGHGFTRVWRAQKWEAGTQKLRKWRHAFHEGDRGLGSSFQGGRSCVLAHGRNPYRVAN